MPNPLPDPIPVTVLTGFLGSGKTTMLGQLMASGALARTLVVINEFGAVGLDHHLVSHISDNFVMMDSGCLCCTIRTDLGDTLANAHWRFARDGQCWFDRVIIETTGLANPVPIAGTLLSDPRLLALYRLSGVVTTLDAHLGPGTLAQHSEAVLQLALADKVVVTKPDLVGPAETAALLAQIQQINPGVPARLVENGRVPADWVMPVGIPKHAADHPEVEAWLNSNAASARGHHHHGHDDDHDHDHHHDHARDVHSHDVHSHGDRVRALCITIDAPLDPQALESWLTIMQIFVGPSLLRLKALLFVRGEAAPLVVHAAQHLLHPTVRLENWSGSERVSKIVVILRDMAPARVLQTLAMLVRETPSAEVQGAPDLVAAMAGDHRD
jgi:G3E family GTPase